MKLLLLFVVQVLSIIIHVKSQQVAHTGDCACVCGLNSAELNPGLTLGTSDSFFDQVRGPKGETGLPGKPGPTGLVGRPGLRGIQGPPGLSEKLPEDRIPRSCWEHRENGNSNSGIYTIKPTATASSINVYCDMNSAGGGWTLVASVHENDINGKCTLGDNWSSDQGPFANNQSYNGTNNWQNFNAFGNVEAATNGDYKSPAYFNMLSGDVMIWHVPNNLEVSQWSDQAFLKYYTSNGFLEKYNGTLQSMYANHYPMIYTPEAEIEIGSTTYRGLISILSALNSTASRTRNGVPDFYSYSYDYSGVQNYIGDGGSDMFDTGNKVFYKIGEADYVQVTYRKTYKDQFNNVEVSSTTEHPFIMLMWVGNDQRVVENFYIKVESGTGADGNGNSRQNEGRIEYEEFTLDYIAYNVYGANDPSISEVFFCIHSVETWDSVPPTSFSRFNVWPRGTDSLINTVQANGNPKSIMMGYTLLSRSNGIQVLDTHIRAALLSILQTISQFHDITSYNCSRIDESVIVPITYITGSNETVVASIPSLFQSQVVPGFIQFRSLNPDGIPNAICPGIKTESCTPAGVCIGGINSFKYGELRNCGDFAGWGGKSNDSPTKTVPDGLSHSLRDLASSILIFTREKRV